MWHSNRALVCKPGFALSHHGTGPGLSACSAVALNGPGAASTLNAHAPKTFNLRTPSWLPEANVRGMAWRRERERGPPPDGSALGPELSRGGSGRLAVFLRVGGPCLCPGALRLSWHLDLSAPAAPLPASSYASHFLSSAPHPPTFFPSSCQGESRRRGGDDDGGT